MNTLRRIVLFVAFLGLAFLGACVGLMIWGIFRALSYAAARDLFAPMP